MGSIRVPTTVDYLAEAVRGACHDKDPLVRRACAVSIEKMHRVNPDAVADAGLPELLATMAGDRNAVVAAASLCALAEIDPGLVGKWVTLADALRPLQQGECSDWAKCQVLEVIEEAFGERLVLEDAPGRFLEVSLPLLQSANAALVMQTVGILVEHLWELLDEAQRRRIATSLISICTGGCSQSDLPLNNVHVMLVKRPDLFATVDNAASAFLPNLTRDSPQVQRAKISILGQVYGKASQPARSVIADSLKSVAKEAMFPKVAKHAISVLARVIPVAVRMLFAEDCHPLHCLRNFPALKPLDPTDRLLPKIATLDLLRVSEEECEEGAEEARMMQLWLCSLSHKERLQLLHLYADVFAVQSARIQSVLMDLAFVAAATSYSGHAEARVILEEGFLKWNGDEEAPFKRSGWFASLFVMDKARLLKAFLQQAAETPKLIGLAVTALEESFATVPFVKRTLDSKEIASLPLNSLSAVYLSPELAAKLSVAKDTTPAFHVTESENKGPTSTSDLIGWDDSSGEFADAVEETSVHLSLANSAPSTPSATKSPLVPHSAVSERRRQRPVGAWVDSDDDEQGGGGEFDDESMVSGAAEDIFGSEWKS